MFLRAPKCHCGWKPRMSQVLRAQRSSFLYASISFGGDLPQAVLGPGAIWASAGPKFAAGLKCAAGSKWWLLPPGVVAFAARNRGFFSCSRPGLSYRLTSRSLLPQLVAFLYARICDLSDRSDAIRPSGLGVKSRFLAVKQLCWKVMTPEI